VEPHEVAAALETPTRQALVHLDYLADTDDILRSQIHTALVKTLARKNLPRATQRYVTYWTNYHPPISENRRPLLWWTGPSYLAL